MKQVMSFILTIFLVSCTAAQPEAKVDVLEAANPGDYAVMVPFDAAPTRYNHGIYLGKVDLMDVGGRLVEKSKAVFDVETHVLAEGNILSLTRVNALLNREATDNPYGLNPPKGSEFDTGVGNLTIPDAILVADLLEINFYTGAPNNPQLSGISIALVFNATVDLDGQLITIADDKLVEYATTAGRKLERYLRSLPDLENIPILIALYKTQKADATLPGIYFSQATFTAREGQFEALNEAWYLFPSQAALQNDVQTSTAFNTYRNAVLAFVPESVGTVGQGFYEDGKLKTLNITVQIQAKTYTEIYALTQILADNLSFFTQADLAITVKLKSVTDTVAMIERTRDNTIRVVMTP
jgi:protein involved in sex pheromone biosynthesis